ncbi:hypothetical protein BaRGS_00014682 [Batillaria attramentaria]|uniref:Uncharacterized protein n=1 Tax=Batillaria attramentaria TaxID=370345 RepID=A0ABD0L3A7_9CAEN
MYKLRVLNDRVGQTVAAKRTLYSKLEVCKWCTEPMGSRHGAAAPCKQHPRRTRVAQCRVSERLGTIKLGGLQLMPHLLPINWHLVVSGIRDC